MTYFWILGPLIFLIERDPADLWLTLISIIFLIRCFYNKDWNWSGQLWFVFAFLFWISSMISGIVGPYDKYSFFQGFIWIRFPLYVAAAQIWLGQDRDIRMVMFTSILIGMIINLISRFKRVNIISSYLMIPYLLWCSFALVLNINLIMIN